GGAGAGRCRARAVLWVDGAPGQTRVPPDDGPRGPSGYEALAVSRDGSVVIGWSFFTGGPAGGWICSEETGARSVHAVLAEAGLGVPGEQRLGNVAAMSADGKVLVGYAEEGIF